MPTPTSSTSPLAREQILAAATRAFARAGFAATSLDDIAAEAQISRVILYRHFDSKADLYRAVLDKICARLAATVGEDNFTDDSITVLIGVAAEDPDAFRLLFRHAFREPEFRDVTDQLQTSAADIARRGVAELLPPGPWTDWAARLAPTLTSTPSSPGSTPANPTPTKPPTASATPSKASSRQHSQLDPERWRTLCGCTSNFGDPITWLTRPGRRSSGTTSGSKRRSRWPTGRG